jgi:hypothetical protein
MARQSVRPHRHVLQVRYGSHLLVTRARDVEEYIRNRKRAASWALRLKTSGVTLPMERKDHEDQERL